MNINLGLIIGTVAYGAYKCYNLYNNYKNLLDSIEKHMKDIEDKIVIHNDYIEIKYNYMAKNYALRIPYDHNKIAQTTQFLVTAKSNDGLEYDITQQPGIPYLLSPYEMNMVNIQIYNMLDDTTLTFTGDQIPMYG